MKMRRFGVLWCFFLWCLAQQISAKDLRGDSIDIHHYQLRLDLRDFDTHVLHGDAEIKITALQNEVHSISLDLLRLTVDSVKVNGVTSSFAYNDSLLDIHFFKALNKNDSTALSVFYHGKPGVLPGDFGGFYWDEQYAFNIGVSFISNPHNYGRAWFPCFDNFRTRSYYEYFVTTRITDKAFCNGTLLDVKTDTFKAVWHWKLKESIPSYLASVAVAAYQTINDTVIGINGVTPIEIAVLPEDTAALKTLFRHLHDAFHILEHYWGPYQWERVGYCIVPFQEGAMEHATNIAFMEYYLNAYERECETTMAHELSHHWFGNLVTCDKAENMWLNEGWASYCQSLFIEGLYGADSAQQYRRNRHGNELQLAHIADGGYLPVSGVPTRQTYGSTVYEKGADIVHTLRYYLGDSLFFNSVKGYLNQYAGKTANTMQLRDYLSRNTSKDLATFFKYWVFAPGYPHFSINDKYIARINGKYEVYVNIRQRLSHAPEYFEEVPVTVSYFDKNMHRHDELVFASGECTTYSTLLDFNPEMIVADYDGNLAQAVTSQSHVFYDKMDYDFSRAQMSVYASGIKDSALIWVALNCLPAEAMLHPFKGVHLHISRFWTVDGVFDPAIDASAVFDYSPTRGDSLEYDFIGNRDSLLMLYRPNQQAEWETIEKGLISKDEVDSDKAGNIIVYPLKKGEYALASYNSQYPAEVRKPNGCQPIQASIKAGNDFKLTVDITNEQLNVDFRKNIFDGVEVCDANGKTIHVRNLSPEENKLTFKVPSVSTESYVVTLITKTGKRITKKLTN